MLKGLQHCFNLYDNSFVISFDHSERTSVRKDSVLVVTDIFRLFVNIFTSYDKYSVSIKVNFSRN